MRITGFGGATPPFGGGARGDGLGAERGGRRERRRRAGADAASSAVGIAGVGSIGGLLRVAVRCRYGDGAPRYAFAVIASPPARADVVVAGGVAGVTAAVVGGSRRGARSGGRAEVVAVVAFAGGAAGRPSAPSSAASGELRATP